MIVCSLSDMGGDIYSMEIDDKTEGKYFSPELEPEKIDFSVEHLNKALGLNLNEKNIKGYLAKMGVGFSRENEKTFALIPAYRTDILHEIDLAEEIAIAYGYDKIEPEFPKISTIAEENPVEIIKKRISDILIGLGLLEISTYHLSTKEKQFKKMGIKEFRDKIIKVIDSKTENDILRVSLLADSIAVLSENSDSSYPQKIFEMGRIFFHNKNSETGIGEKERLCISICHEKTNFTEIKQVLDYLMKMFDKKYEIKEAEHPSFIEGRVGEIFIEGKTIGVIGEISPIILKNNKIWMPVASLEMDINCFLNSSFSIHT